MKKLIIAIFSIAYISVSAQFYSGPESVEFDYTNNRWLIGNNGSGQIISRDSTGALSVFAEDFCSSGPYGLEIVNGFLFACANNGSVFIFDLEGNQVIDSPINLGAEFLNGITHDNTGQLYITDFSSQSVYKMDATTYQYSIVADATDLNSTPNGIIFDEENNRCIIVTWGSNAKILALDISTNAVTTLVNNTTLGNIDGIAKNSSGTYFLSSWSENAISTIDNNFSSTPVEIITGLDSPADIFYNTVSDTLAIPNSGNNTVDFIGFDPVISIGEKNKIDSTIEIYPNPFADKTTVKFNVDRPSAIQYSIINILGQIIDQNEIFINSTGVSTFEIKNIQPGFYSLLVQTPSKRMIKKFQVIN